MKKVIFAFFAFSLALQGSDALAKCSDFATCADAVKAMRAGDGELDRDKTASLAKNSGAKMARTCLSSEESLQALAPSFPELRFTRCCEIFERKI